MHRVLIYHAPFTHELVISNGPLSYAYRGQGDENHPVLVPDLNQSMTLNTQEMYFCRWTDFALDPGECAWFSVSANSLDGNITLVLRDGFSSWSLFFGEVIENIPENKVYLLKQGENLRHSTDPNKVDMLKGTPFPDVRRAFIVEKRVLAIHRVIVRANEDISDESLIAGVHDRDLDFKPQNGLIYLHDQPTEDWTVVRPTEDELASLEDA